MTRAERTNDDFLQLEDRKGERKEARGRNSRVEGSSLKKYVQSSAAMYIRRARVYEYTDIKLLLLMHSCAYIPSSLKIEN